MAPPFFPPPQHTGHQGKESEKTASITPKQAQEKNCI